MKEQTAVKWLVNQALSWNRNRINGNDYIEFPKEAIDQAKDMESKERLKHLLLIGKVTEILGFDKTVELLKECNNEIL